MGEGHFSMAYCTYKIVEVPDEMHGLVASFQISDIGVERVEHLRLERHRKIDQDSVRRDHLE